MRTEISFLVYCLKSREINKYLLISITAENKERREAKNAFATEDTRRHVFQKVLNKFIYCVMNLIQKQSIHINMLMFP